MIRPVVFEDETLKLIDQRLLPNEEVVNDYTNYRDIIGAIKEMVVRGAPAIGITGAYALVLAARELRDESAFFERLIKASEEIVAARPTAVNLAWAVERAMGTVSEEMSPDEIYEKLKAEANAIRDEDAKMCRNIGKNGAALFDEPVTVLTHCNAGALATAEYGTALGVVRALEEAGKLKGVYADETRPLLQGARLTAYELVKDGIDTTLITDNMAALMMKEGNIDCIVVGADRIAHNGDTANKIGTYGLSVLARAHGIPFFIAAPTSTIDVNTETGEGIEIEERDGEEVKRVGESVVAPNAVKVINPAFDVTPWENIDGIITEKGVLRAPYKENIDRLFN